ncbi:hypothetical protein [Geodermatophilus sp. SYSU D00691]
MAVAAILGAVVTYFIAGFSEAFTDPGEPGFPEGYVVALVELACGVLVLVAALLALNGIGRPVLLAGLVLVLVIAVYWLARAMTEEFEHGDGPVIVVVALGFAALAGTALGLAGTASVGAWFRQQRATARGPVPPAVP